MSTGPSVLLALALIATAGASAVGKAWDVSPSANPDPSSRPSWPRLDASSASTSAFEVRSVSGVGRKSVTDEPRERDEHRGSGRELREALAAAREEYDARERRDIEDLEYRPADDEGPLLEEFSRDRRQLIGNLLDDDSEESEESASASDEDGDFEFERLGRSVPGIFPSAAHDSPIARGFPAPLIAAARSPHRARARRDADTKMEKIAGAKSVREARLNSPETWSKQPISVEFRHRGSAPQDPAMLHGNGLPGGGGRIHQAPKTDFVTSHHHHRGRDYAEGRESREMPLARAYEEAMYRDRMRERDLDVPFARDGPVPRGYYPDRRYRTERDYYPRAPVDAPPFYRNRYLEDELDVYGRSRSSPKPKRIVYYATLPEIVRKPVDLRGYAAPGRPPYDGRPPAAAISSTYKRLPAIGNMDVDRYRYRSPSHPYDRYESRGKRPEYYDRPYVPYQAPRTEDDPRAPSVHQDRDRAALKEDPRGPPRDDLSDSGHDRQMPSNRVSTRDDSRLPWSVQVGTEVNVRDDERIPGRRIFGQGDSYQRYQNAQPQSAPSSLSSDGERGSNSM